MEEVDVKLYWVWLSLAFSYGSDKPNEILSRFETPQDFFNLNGEDMLMLGFLTEKDVRNVK
ncbi:MAG: hypothetical protein RR444_06300, partial [Oscillospiraceae bacterium]